MTLQKSLLSLYFFAEKQCHRRSSSDSTLCPSGISSRSSDLASRYSPFKVIKRKTCFS